MSIGLILEIASSALNAQSQRITAIAQNLANANSVLSPDGHPYQRRVLLFEPVPVPNDGGGPGLGVKVAAVLRDTAPPRLVHDPANPLADKDGNVKQPAINPILEMVDLLEASRSYEANLSVLQTARAVATRTLDLLR